MANPTTAATVPKTPTHGGPELDSTLLTVGSTAVSPEGECEDEPVILLKVHEITKGDNETKVNHHIQKMIWSNKLEDKFKANISMALGLTDDTERGKYVIHNMNMLLGKPITDLSKDEFPTAWWDIDVYQYALLGNRVNRDLSHNDLTDHTTQNGRYTVVLNDFDLLCHKFEDTSMANIRMASRFKDAELGKHVLYITVSRKLHPITKLSGMKFLSAWWYIVVCHYTLWGQNFRHRDVNPSNLMVYKGSDGRYIGVLNEFDLSSTQDSPSGGGRTGTVPFVAIELLTKGKIKHLYRHDAESFIWVLTWVCLRYREGMLLNKGRQLDRWLQVDAIKCRKEKSDFLIFGRHGIEPSSSHADSWIVARSSLRLVGLFYAGDPESSDSESELYSHSPTDAAVFETWLGQRIHKVLPPELLDVCVESS